MLHPSSPQLSLCQTLLKTNIAPTQASGIETVHRGAIQVNR